MSKATESVTVVPKSIETGKLSELDLAEGPRFPRGRSKRQAHVTADDGEAGKIHAVTKRVGRTRDGEVASNLGHATVRHGVRRGRDVQVTVDDGRLGARNEGLLRGGRGVAARGAVAARDGGADGGDHGEERCMTNV
jgi:hypothetical protein